MSSLLPLLLLMAEVDLPGTSSVSVPLVSPSACRSCHGSFDPLAAHESWLGSPMGHAARNPLFLAALSLAELDRPNTGDFCLRCHVPDAWLSGKCIEPDGSLLTDEDDGVGCAVCHRMDPSPYLKNGQFLIGEDIDYRGPYADATAPHRFQQGAWISTSELCGSCHDLFNPLVTRRDLNGADMGMLFPEQTTYSEWAASTSSATNGCKDCHMPESVSPVAEGAAVRNDRSSHEFSGGNLFLLRSIDFLEPGLGLTVQLVRGQLRIETQLRSAATLELVDAPSELQRGEPFTLTFRITNKTGHKLPTGYPEGRRVWLSIASPELGIDLGAYDTLLGEPIAPAAIYHVRQGQFAVGPAGPTHHLTLNDVVFLDTRIPPEGMSVTATIAPVGKTYPEVAPGVLAHWDEVTITATTPCDMAAASINLQAALWYQSVNKTYAGALIAESGNEPRALRLATAFEEADPGPTEMVMIAENLPIAAGSSCGPPDAGFTDTGITDAGDVAPDADVTSDAGPMKIEGGCGCRATRRATRAPDGLSGLGLIVVLLGFAARVKRR